MEAPKDYEPQEIDVVTEVNGEKVVVGKGITWSDASGIGMTVEIDPEKAALFRKHFLNDFSISTEI